MNKKHLVFVVMPDSLAMDLIGPSEVFNLANEIIGESKSLDQIKEGYEITFASAIPSLEIKLNNKLVIKSQTTIYDIDKPIDTLLIAGFSGNRQWKEYQELYQWILSNSVNIRRIASVCVGAFVLAETGLLDGRNATTHWNSCKEFQLRYPQINVIPNAIFVQDGAMYTSAGVSCGIDLALSLVEEDYGKKMALEIAQSLVLYVKRSGGQSQFSFLLEEQFSEQVPIRKLQEWIINNLNKDLRISVLASKVSMSERNFVRVFQKDMGITPTKYIEKMRIESVKQLLVETSLSLDRIATSCGFLTKDTMSKTFKRYSELTPNQYRQYKENQ